MRIGLGRVVEGCWGFERKGWCFGYSGMEVEVAMILRAVEGRNNSNGSGSYSWADSYVWVSCKESAGVRME